MRLPVNSVAVVEGQFPKLLAEDGFGIGLLITDGDAIVQDKSIILVLLPVSVRRQLHQAAKAQLAIEQRRLRLGQQNGAAADGIENGVYFARFNRSTFARAFD